MFDHDAVGPPTEAMVRCPRACRCTMASRMHSRLSICTHGTSPPEPCIPMMMIGGIEALEGLVELDCVDTVGQLLPIQKLGGVTDEELSDQPVLLGVQGGSVRADQNTRMLPESTLG